MIEYNSCNTLAQTEAAYQYYLIMSTEHADTDKLRIMSWSMEKNEQLVCNEVDIPVEGNCAKLIVNQHQTELVGCYEIGGIVLWDLSNGYKNITRLWTKTVTSWLYTVCYMLNERVLACAGLSSVIFFIDSRSGNIIHQEPDAHSGEWISALVFFEHDNLLVSVGGDKCVKIWSISSANQESSSSRNSDIPSLSCTLLISIKNPFDCTCHSMLQLEKTNQVLVGDQKGNMFSVNIKTGKVELKNENAHGDIVKGFCSEFDN